MTSAQFTEWMAFFRLEPFGEQRADLRMGITTANLMNALTGGKAHAKPQDFMPFRAQPKPDSQSLSQQLRAWAAAHNERSRKTGNPTRG